MKRFYLVIVVILLFFSIPFLHDTVRCRAPSGEELKRTIIFQQLNDRVSFKSEGVANCLLSTEGSFPKWYQIVTLEIPAGQNSLKPDHDRVLEFSKDFQGTSLTGGTITIDRATQSLFLKLSFQKGSEFQDAVNGRYNYSEAIFR